jgi:hypothetical protein
LPSFMPDEASGILTSSTESTATDRELGVGGTMSLNGLGSMACPRLRRSGILGRRSARQMVSPHVAPI